MGNRLSVVGTGTSTQSSGDFSNSGFETPERSEQVSLRRMLYRFQRAT